MVYDINIPYYVYSNTHIHIHVHRLREVESLASNSSIITN